MCNFRVTPLDIPSESKELPHLVGIAVTGLQSRVGFSYQDQLQLQGLIFSPITITVHLTYSTTITIIWLSKNSNTIEIVGVKCKYFHIVLLAI